jgi:antirestriction protein ArdC
VPTLREYCVFNVAQRKGLPASIVEGKPARVRNPDGRDPLADEFLASSGAIIREGAGEAYYAPGQDFISMPAFTAFKAQTISTALPSTNSLIGKATRQGLTET